MEKMVEATEGEAEQPLSPRIPKYAKDLLRRFSGNFRPEEWRAGASESKEEDWGEIELGLGLSLGGCFGVDRAQKRGLARSSSVASLPFLQRGEGDLAAVPVITRTCSLPVDTDEEQRKRKELQSLRRMEAKRKRSEKRNSSRSGGTDRSGPPPEEGYVGGEDMMQQDGEGSGGKEGRAEAEAHPRACPAAPNGVTAAAWAARVATRVAEGTRGFAPAPQGSVGSQGSCSSGLSDFDTRPPTRQQGSGGVAGVGDGSETSSPPSTRPPPSVAGNRAATGHTSPPAGKPTSVAPREAEDPSKKTAAGGAGGGVNRLRHMMQEMPCVSTEGVGPNGRRVEGFLCRYRKGQDVRIMCVCHGTFFSPAEFVKHAGGGEVAHPLRHIVVNPRP